MAARTRQGDAPASVLDVDRGETLTLSREDFENAAAGPRDGRDDTYASIQSGLLGEDEAFGRATVHRLVVDGPEGSRVVVPAGAATADGVLEARGGVHVECHDPLQEVLLHDQATLEAPEGLRRLRALDESRADVDLTHAPDGYAVLLANEAEGVLKGDAAGGNELVNEALKGYPDYMGYDRPDQRVTGARGRVVGMDDADIVATDVPCVRLGSRFDDTPEDDPRLAQPTGAAFGRTGMILDGRAVADLYGASTAAVYGDAMAKAHGGTKAVAHQSGAVVPGDATGPFAAPFSRNAAKGSPDAPSDHTSADASDVRLLGYAAQDPTGRFRLSDPDAVLSPWPEEDDIEVPATRDESPVGKDDACEVIDGVMTLRRNDVTLSREDFEKAPLVHRNDDGTGPLVHGLTVRGPYDSKVTIPEGEAGDDCLLNVEGGVAVECLDPYLETVVSGFATLHAPDGMYDLTALQNSSVFIDQAHVADGYAVLVADHATGVIDGGMREDSDLMERAREGDFGPFPSGQVVGLGGHAGIVATDVPSVHLWQGARGAAFGHTGVVLEQGSQADLYGRATAVARGSSQVRMQDDAKVLAMDGASVSAGDGLALHGASPWFDRSAASEYPRIRHHAPDKANVHLSGDASLDAGSFAAASEAVAEDAAPTRRRPSTAARIMAEAPAGADGPQDEPAR